jgi:antitoxin (DNA-binding transcriptional repressor) of toxin-antitoxin stability system
MKELSIREAREQLTAIEELVEKEGEIILTRRGKAVARILPLTGPRKLPSRASLRRKMPRLKTPSEALVRLDRDSR